MKGKQREEIPEAWPWVDLVLHTCLQGHWQLAADAGLNEALAALGVVVAWVYQVCPCLVEGTET